MTGCLRVANICHCRSVRKVAHLLPPLKSQPLTTIPPHPSVLHSGNPGKSNDCHSSPALQASAKLSVHSRKSWLYSHRLGGGEVCSQNACPPLLTAFQLSVCVDTQPFVYHHWASRARHISTAHRLFPLKLALTWLTGAGVQFCFCSLFTPSFSVELSLSPSHLSFAFQLCVLHIATRQQYEM